MILYDEHKKRFSERLRKSRKEKGLTQVELAEKIGCFQTQLSAWEKGERKPEDDTIKKISKVLDVSEDWLKLGEGETDYKETKYGVDITIKHITNNSSTNLTNDYKKLDNDDKHIVNELVDLLNERKDR